MVKLVVLSIVINEVVLIFIIDVIEISRSIFKMIEINDIKKCVSFILNLILVIDFLVIFEIWLISYYLIIKIIIVRMNLGL